MIPTLHPEILVKIVHQLCDSDNGSDDFKREQQQTMARLMTVSKVFNEICTTGIYKDCLVSSHLNFIEGLSTPSSAKQEQLSKVQTLRLCHTPQILNPPYFRLMADCRGWKATGVKGYLEHDITDLELETEWQLRIDAEDLMVAALRIRGPIRQGEMVLPGLKRVVMMGAADSHQIVEAARWSKGISDVLVSMPGVDYYCQSSGLGPLSLSNVIYQPLLPPRIATFHLSRSSIMLRRARLQPPIILGSINRYIWAGDGGAGTLQIETRRPFQVTDIVPETILFYLQHIIDMLDVRSHLVKQLPTNVDSAYAEDGSCTEEVPLNSVSLEDTSIEIYNYVVNVIKPSNTFDGPVQMKAPKVHPISMDVYKALEELLNTRIGRWRGKVIFRSGTDLPTCPACLDDGPIPNNETAEREPVAKVTVRGAAA